MAHRSQDDELGKRDAADTANTRHLLASRGKPNLRNVITSNMIFVSGATIAVFTAFLLSYSQPVRSTDFAQSCDALSATADFDNATIVFSQHILGGTNLTFPDNPESCTRPSQVVPVDICRIVLSVATSDRSKINVEGWLPSNWSGRVLSTGNGGISGCIQFEDLAYGSSLGFAAFGSNGGHDGMTGVEFLNNEDVIADFSWRALHTTANVAKDIAPQLYSRNYTKSYYLGCSTGGRQGWKSAQSYPSDFDGIVAGAPALAFNNLTSWSSTFYQLFQHAGPDGFPPSSTWSAIDAAMLSQCDYLDGSSDGIVEVASLCNAIFRPEALVCGSNATNMSTCISPLQAETIRALFSPTYGADGTLLFPPLPAVPGVTSLAYSVYSPEPFLYSSDWYRYAIYNNASLDISGLTPQDWSYAWRLNPASSNTWSGDLTSFRSRGGKILTYHGQSDGIISPMNSERYYDHVSRTMGARSDELDEFYRFFRISGMEHCEGGDGAWAIGNGAGDALGAGRDDPQENVLMAVVRWVEDGIAPETLTGTKYEDSDEGERGVVDYKRVHCRYPYRNVFVESEWRCV